MTVRRLIDEWMIGHTEIEVHHVNRIDRETARSVQCHPVRSHCSLQPFLPWKRIVSVWERELIRLFLSQTAPLNAITQSDGHPQEYPGKVPDGQKVRFGHLLEDRSMHRGVEEHDISHVLPPILSVEDIRVRTSCRSTTEEVRERLAKIVRRNSS